MNVEAENAVGRFLATAPLYQRLDLSEWMRQGALAEWDELKFVSHILRYCPSKECKIERPYRRLGDETGFVKKTGKTSGPPNIVTILYTCTYCGSNFWCAVEASRKPGERVSIRKIGQDPPYDISIASDLEAALGEDTMLYKRAQICMSQSFGVGACTYLRRLLENQIAPLLRLVYEARKEEGEDVGDLSRIMKERVAEKKIRLANQVLPASVAVEGDNPLELIYDRLSAGLHRGDEQECMEIAVEASEILKHVIISLNDEGQRRQSKSRYVEMLRGLRKRGG